MRRRLALPLSLLLGWLQPMAHAEALLLRLAAQTGLPHKYNVGGEGQPGFCLEYIQALSQVDPGLRCSGLDDMLPTLRIEQELAAGRVEVFFGMLKTPEREAASSPPCGCWRSTAPRPACGRPTTCVDEQLKPSLKRG
ncbi:hypothetical protein [Roseateles asaccharophilus]|uniref:Uncharacterized protein n=1 Tax=Roseateles asaccharophilus TaxID=582607 RepID=A0ABU2A7J9_9BURK|nr:hypothetical protein [Roseateles asaccharophilus]MDR7333176.1 hypothetical protein [Roseateles asaccharophilus]